MWLLIWWDLTSNSLNCFKSIVFLLYNSLNQSTFGIKWLKIILMNRNRWVVRKLRIFVRLCWNFQTPYLPFFQKIELPNIRLRTFIIGSKYRSTCRDFVFVSLFYLVFIYRVAIMILFFWNFNLKPTLAARFTIWESIAWAKHRGLLRSIESEHQKQSGILIREYAFEFAKHQTNKLSLKALRTNYATICNRNQIQLATHTYGSLIKLLYSNFSFLFFTMSIWKDASFGLSKCQIGELFELRLQFIVIVSIVAPKTHL